MDTHSQHHSQHYEHREVGADRLLSFAEAKLLVSLSRSKIYLLLAAGDFPVPVKIGTKNYFSECEIQAWIAAQLRTRTHGCQQ